MGASDVVPGVSGGTIAFITGIYNRLISAIKNLNITAIKLFITGKFRALWHHIDGSFLLCVLMGIAVSFLSLAKLITFLIETQPVLVWSFFFGLIVASTLFVARDVKWNIKTILAFVIFAIISFLITSPQNEPLNTNGSYWYIFICGAIAICAMILPGISGSFILVLLGQYIFILQALIDFKIGIIITFIAGALSGIIGFSHVLSWLFKHYKMITLASLTGFMFGSLNKIWPWKNTLAFYIDRHGIERPLVQENILPHNHDGNLGYAILLIIVGLTVIFAIELIAKKLKATK